MHRVSFREALAFLGMLLVVTLLDLRLSLSRDSLDQHNMLALAVISLTR